MAAKKGLTARQGKTLRFVVSRTFADPERIANAGQPVEPAQCIVKIEWSDLPKTINQASATLKQLERQELVRREGAGYLATDAGKALIAKADAEGKWRT